MNIDLRLGDCIEVMKSLPDNSVDSVITDPPYHLTSSKGSSKGFMNKEWDGGDIAFRTEVWAECLRVLKPGGYLLSFSSPRTYHRMAVAIEDAGFEIRDQISWIFGSGFPKSHNIGKAIDKIQGNEREVVGRKIQRVDGTTRNKQPNGGFMKENMKTKPSDGYVDIEKPGSEDSEMWEGWGSALKPAFEPICMARKPLSEKSIAENVLKWGTGGINIDGCRIGDEVRTTPIHSDDVKDDTTMFGLHKTIQHHREETTEGRFPANLILECICDEVIPGDMGKVVIDNNGIIKTGDNGIYGKYKEIVRTTYTDKGNTHTNPECPCYMLDQQSGITKPGHHPKSKTTGYGKFGNGSSTYEGVGKRDQVKGGASRFFYCPKVSKKERDMGMTGEDKKSGSYNFRQDASLDGKTTLPRKNIHPTVKPIALMKYLIKLVSPPNAVILEPFLGSGSTGIAAKELGFISTFIGIEKEQEYMDIAKQRIGE